LLNQLFQTHVDGRNLNEAKNLLRNYLASPITPDDPPRSEALLLVKKLAVGQ